jgi:hypothetical protein
MILKDNIDDWQNIKRAVYLLLNEDVQMSKRKILQQELSKFIKKHKTDFTNLKEFNIAENFIKSISDLSNDETAIINGIANLSNRFKEPAIVTEELEKIIELV